MSRQTTLDGGGHVVRRTGSGKKLEAFPKHTDVFEVFACEVCAHRFKTPQGLAGHRYHAHGARQPAPPASASLEEVLAAAPEAPPPEDRSLRAPPLD